MEFYEDILRFEIFGICVNCIQNAANLVSKALRQIAESHDTNAKGIAVKSIGRVFSLKSLILLLPDHPTLTGS